MTANLKTSLSIGSVDDAELSSLLLAHFRHSHAGLSDEVEFYRERDGCAIKLVYKKGEIVSAVGGPGLMPEDVPLLADKIRRELITSTGKMLARCILLSSYRVTGSFTYGDKLRLYPVPHDAPQAPDLTEFQYFVEHLEIEHPFVAEFPINGSANSVIQFERLERKARQYTLLLNVFLEGNVSRASRGSERSWVHEEGADLSSGYKYLRQGYRYPDFGDMGISPNLHHTRQFPPMETMEYYEYFSNPRQDLNPPMRVPILLATFLDRYESLNRAEQDRFLRSAFWFQHASRVRKESNSAAYLALVSSIEPVMHFGRGESWW